MKKNLLAIAAVLFALASLAAAAFTYNSANRTLKEYNTQLDILTAQNESLRAQLDALAVQQETVSIPVDMEAWDLTASAWGDGTGADVTLTVVPSHYTDDLTAQLQIYLNNELAADIPCSWNGAEFTATAALPAANGYYYLFILGNAHFELNDALTVNLADSLAAYCNLILAGWHVSENNLILTSCYSQIQLPAIVPDGLELTAVDAALVLRCAETEVSRQTIALADGEAEGSYEMDGPVPTLELPELSDGDLLELWLEVTLSDGRLLSTCGGSWLCTEGALELSVG